MSYKLEKDVILFKNQFDKLSLNIYQGYKVDRLSLDLDSILARLKYMIKHNKPIEEVREYETKFSELSLRLRMAFGEIIKIMLTQITCPDYDDLITDILIKDVKIDQINVKFKLSIISDDISYLEIIDKRIPDNTEYNIFPNEYFRFNTDSYNDAIAKAYPELFEERKQTKIGTGDDQDVFVHNLTIQTTEKCSLACTYCLAEDTPILMADYTSKYIRDIKIGDMVLGCKEESDDNYIFPTKVTNLFRRKSKCYQIRIYRGTEITSDCDKCIYITKEHPVLTNRGWVKVEDVDDENDILICVLTVNLTHHTLTNWKDIKVSYPIGIPCGWYEINSDFGTEEIDVYNFETESHTYIADNLIVHNCYQEHKSEMRMSFETAKEFIDKLLNDEYGYINRYNSPALILEFIGGEPLLEISLTRKIYEYFLDRCYKLNHPWFSLHRLSLCSNGLAYFEPEVQSFFKDYAHNISFNISIDGNKELHDACRIQPNGEGSYDIAMAALNHYNSHYTSERNSKMTLAPSNIKYLYDSVVDFINKGMKTINLNCVFEEGWNQETAKMEYEQLKKLADYIIDNNLESIYIAIFRENQEDMYEKDYDGSYCFKDGTAILTEYGSINISKLKLGDIVYTASGSKHIVKRLTSYKSSNNKVFRVSGAFPIHCTADHKVFAKKFLYMGWKGVIHYSEPGFYPVSELKVGDRIALPMLDFSKNKKNWINDEIAYMLGVFLADGYINENIITITPGYDYDRYYRDCIIKAKLTFTEYSAPTTMQYRINRNGSSLNEAFFKLCLACGHLAYNKHFPQIIFESHIDTIKKCIKGYCDTDGYTVTNSHISNARNGLIKVNSVSPWLMNDLLILLRSIGEYPTCYYYPRAGKSTIQGRVVNIRDGYEVYFNPTRRNSAKLFKKDDTYNVIWSGIKMIQDDNDEYDVYCPTVYPLNKNEPEEHTIIANNIASIQCGGQGSMLAVRPNGQFYPCLRYMPSSVGSNVRDLCIGTVKDGMHSRTEGSEILKLLDGISRRGSTNDICYECPIANSCAYCLALCHTIYGTPNKRVTFTCIQMFAEHLANVYYWNRLLIKHPDYNTKVRRLVIPDEWALLVINKDELEELKLLESFAIAKRMEYKMNHPSKSDVAFFY